MSTSVSQPEKSHLKDSFQFSTKNTKYCTNRNGICLSSSAWSIFGSSDRNESEPTWEKGENYYWKGALDSTNK